MADEQKNKIISASVTTVVMAALLLICLFCGLTWEVPPPQPKRALLIELSTMGGGGGGGMEAAHNRTRHGGEQIATQEWEDSPAVNSNPNATRRRPENAIPEPQPDPNAVYRPGRGGGSGGGSGTGTGSGSGSGIGPGSGSGSGGGIGYGTGSRGYTYMPDLTVREHGEVYVEVRITADGTVSEARVITNARYPTTITSYTIQQQCVEKAKTAKYKPGKEELRIIVFK
ncbi:MAG: hypothetical protein LBL18_05115 [Bacteroidales bacterium]|jgi:hypothetical protein|nr:hypothetical protein [Bacteroidales bacterium]